MNDESAVHKSVQDYYGKVLQSSSDLKTSACCPVGAMPRHIAAIVRELHPEVNERFYGCGSPLPPALDGATVLDLGCGTGRDCFVLSKLVGEQGKVIGVDMTDEQLEVANRHRDYHAEKFGHAQSNVEFRKGLIEDLAIAGIADNSVDLVVSNCVLNLSPDKPAVFREIFRVLKPGGELYFSDVFSDRRIPEHIANDEVIRGECLGGAIYTEDFRRLMQEFGCADARTVSASVLDITNPEIEAQAGFINFYSNTVRAFKLPLEDRCEDYGQIAVYKGDIAEHPHYFDLDDHHRFFSGKPMLVCGNTADMISATRYAPHFTVSGDKSAHYGIFDCGPNPVSVGAGDCATGCC